MLINKLEKCVGSLGLDLSGKVVLTEAATGPYVVTPILAALAGAKVFAFSRSTSFGSAEYAISSTKQVFKNYHKKLDINFITKLTPEILSQADVITNSGHLRPLDKEKLSYAKDDLVIPLMYEAWEWREQDMDLNYIRHRGFRIGATNERHANIDVFNYLGDMAVKQIFDAGLCLYNNRFILISNNDFGPYIAKVVSKMCKKLGVIDLPQNRNKYSNINIEWISDFPEIEINKEYCEAEAVIFTAYPFDLNWIGRDTPLSIEKLKLVLKHPFILRFAGDIDEQFLQQEGVPYFPEKVKSGHMGILPSEIGNDAIIRLQAGGLKVAEALLNEDYQDSPYVQLLGV